ncbi:hypothetical protein IAQ61_010960 [Plenodomus lingam]|uniref:uncharacterized protein n=1 Tax=Leptosphaeria maculans TaxID=5022 RepID=UPI003327A28F|nr:hypothetical protein IAQ61_010960 [Plenodomus lingam]
MSLNRLPPGNRAYKGQLNKHRNQYLFHISARPSVTLTISTSQISISTGYKSPNKYQYQKPQIQQNSSCLTHPTAQKSSNALLSMALLSTAQQLDSPHPTWNLLILLPVDPSPASPITKHTAQSRRVAMPLLFSHMV